MSDIVLDGASAEAFGHPTECSEPASGTVEANSSITYNGTPIATADSSSIEFTSHAHEFDAENEECIDLQSHSVAPDNFDHSVTYHGEPLFIVDDSVGTDPGSGGDIDIVDSGGNNSIGVF